MAFGLLCAVMRLLSFYGLLCLNFSNSSKIFDKFILTTFLVGLEADWNNSFSFLLIIAKRECSGFELTNNFSFDELNKIIWIPTDFFYKFHDIQAYSCDIVHILWKFHCHLKISFKTSYKRWQNVWNWLLYILFSYVSRI